MGSKGGVYFLIKKVFKFNALDRRKKYMAGINEHGKTLSERIDANIRDNENIVGTNYEKLDAKAIDKIREVFGEENLSLLPDYYCRANGTYFEDRYRFFAGFGGKKEFPNLKPRYKDWTVFALARFVESTGEMLEFKYQTPDGRLHHTG